MPALLSHLLKLMLLPVGSPERDRSVIWEENYIFPVSIPLFQAMKTNGWQHRSNAFSYDIGQKYRERIPLFVKKVPSPFFNVTS